MKRIVGWSSWKMITPIVAVTAIAAGVFLTIQLASGDPTPPPPTGIVDISPPPQPPLPPGTAVEAAPLPADGEDSVTVNGVKIPIPTGAQLGTQAGGYLENGPNRGIYRGSSYVLFNNNGVREAKIASEDQADFQPTLDALESAAADSQ